VCLFCFFSLTTNKLLEALSMLEAAGIDSALASHVSHLFGTVGVV